MRVKRCLVSLAALFLLAAPGRLLAQDSDADGLPDTWEIAHPCLMPFVADADVDYDADLLTSLEEYQYSPDLDPCAADTDGDGVDDGWETNNSCMDPVNPWLSPIGTYDTPDSALAVYVAGNYAYVADHDSGLQIINVSNPASPILAGTYDTPGSANGVYVSGNYAYVTDGYSGLQIINVSNPASPTLVGTCDTPGYAQSVYVSGNYAYVADSSSGLQIINISNPSSPTLAGSYATVGYTHRVYVSGNYAYISGYMVGLKIINVSNPASPTLAGTYATAGSTYGVYVSGNYAHVADYYYGLKIINVSNPASPTLAGTDNTSINAYGVYVSGNYAYVADIGGRLQIIDVSRPASPTLAGTYQTQEYVYGVFVSGSYAYLANNMSGLKIVSTVSDSDLDGLPDPAEYQIHTDPCDPDTDDDGLTDGEEYFAPGTNPNPGAPDSDGDGMSDDYELSFGCLMPFFADASVDYDADFLTSLEEYQYSMDLNPCVADTDSDGKDDGTEVFAGSNPLLDFITPTPRYSIEQRVIMQGVQFHGYQYSVEWTGSEYLVADGNQIRRFGADGALLPGKYSSRFAPRAWHNYLTQMSWTGSELVVIDSHTKFTRLSPDLRLIDTVTVSDTDKLIWTGTEFGAIFDVSYPNISFYRLSPQGQQIGPTITDSTGNLNYRFHWTGSEFVLFNDRILTRISPQGVLIGQTTLPLLIYNAVWTGAGFLAIRDYYLYEIGPTGALMGTPKRVSNLYNMTLVTEPGMGLVLGVDYSNYNCEIFILAPDGTTLGSFVDEISCDGRMADRAFAWNGSEVAQFTFEQGGVIRLSTIKINDRDGDRLDDDDEALFPTDPDDWDTDDDGMGDGYEAGHACLNPIIANDGDADPDGDGFTNREEFLLFTDACASDSDGDGLSDHDEALIYLTDPMQPDTDQDGLNDGNEVNVYLTNPFDADTDGDGMTDGFEAGRACAGISPLTGDSLLDGDTDGLTNLGEFHQGTDPCNPDTDGDGLTDGAEVNTHGTSPLLADTDGDGLDDPTEFSTSGTDPLLPDTDGDGLTDGDEVNTHESNPLLSDTDGDGMEDGWEADYACAGINPLVGDSMLDADGDGLTSREEFQLGTDPCNPDTDGDSLDDRWEATYSCLDPLQKTPPPATSQTRWDYYFYDVRNIVVSGNYAYLADYYYGLVIIDVSDPALPRLAGEYSYFDDRTSYRYLDVYVSGGYAYLTHEQGLSILDVSNPSDPFPVGSYGFEGYANKIIVSENYAFILGDRLQIMDVSDPSHPRLAGTYPGPTSGYNDFVVADGYAYLWVSSEEGGGGIMVIDISDPAHPFLAGQISFSDMYWIQLVSDGYAYIYVYRESGRILQIFDVSDPALPILASEIPMPDIIVDRGMVSGNHAYLWSYSYLGYFGVQVIEVADPFNPVFVSSLEIDSDTNALVVSNNYLYSTQYDQFTIMALADHDFDGLIDTGEYAAGTNPCIPDSDSDGMKDGFEASHGCLFPNFFDADSDSDNDGLDNLDEMTAGADPCRSETDGDGHDDSHDCAPTDPNHWDDCGACVDRDGDERGSACNLGPDCNDSNNRTWDTCATCADADGDTRWVGCNVNINPDCAPNDPDHWNDCATCIDQDLDGRGVGCNRGNDCNDANTNVWYNYNCYCTDRDGDTWYEGCNRYVTINGPDCDDSNARAWNTCSTCKDNDGDAWWAGCNAYPDGKGPDCNDGSSRTWNTCVTCQETDGDNWWAGCNAYPDGKGPDCNDGNPYAWTACATCADVDADTWYGVCDRYAGPNLLTVGTGTDSWYAPLDTYYQDTRTQSIILASEIGRAGTITALALDVTTIPGQVMNNFTIRLKHTSLSTQYSWEGPASGWTTVYQANQTISSTGWSTFTFTTPFNYNGLSNLMVDISFNNTTNTSKGRVRMTYLSYGRSIYYSTNSGYSDPLNWTGTSNPAPYSSSYVPNIRFSFFLSSINGPDCNNTNPNTWNACATCLDADADTWFDGCNRYLTINGPDCDDTIATGASCHNTCSTFYLDQDSDAYGAPASFALRCSAGGGYVADWNDCAPTVSTIHPGAPEACDGLDNQCPGDAGYGAIDEGCVPPDTDGDGLSDGLEIIIGTNPSNPDTDGDGLNDGLEYNTLGTDPNGWDSDNDGLPDGFEVANMTDHDTGENLDPLKGTGDVGDDGILDFDGDGILNAHEYWNGTSLWAANPSGYAACGYWGESDGDGWVTGNDRDMLLSASIGNPTDYSNVFPPTGETQDLDGDGWFTGNDLDLITAMMLGAAIPYAQSRPAALEAIDTCAATLAVGDTCHVSVAVLNSMTPTAGRQAGIAVVFTVDPSSTGSATIFGGEGAGDLGAGRYDLSTSALSSPAGVSRVVVRADAAGTVKISARVPQCGTEVGVGRSSAEIVLPIFATVTVP